MSAPVRGLAAFVKKKRAGWERLDALSARLDRERLGAAEVEELDRLYRRAAGDLAYARSAFPGTDAAGYLAQVTARAYGALYRRKPPREGAARDFLLHEIPAAFAANLRAFGLSCAFLLAGVVAGAVAVLADPSVAPALLPQGVLDAVAQGRMWTDDIVSAAPGFVSSRIFTNNITVTVTVFGSGLLTLGFGTAYILFSNGLLLGAAAAHCATHGLAHGFFGFVAAHGPAELSCILIAGQAAFLLAGGIIDPGEWPRSAALQARGREALRLMALCVPLLVVIGLVEGYVSPGPLFPLPLKAALGLGLMATMYLYLVRLGRGAKAEAAARALRSA